MTSGKNVTLKLKRKLIEHTWTFPALQAADFETLSALIDMLVTSEQAARKTAAIRKNMNQIGPHSSPRHIKAKLRWLAGQGRAEEMKELMEALEALNGHNL